MKNIANILWLLPLFVVAVVLIGVTVTNSTPKLEGTGAVSTLDYWLERYQALTAGLLALTAGALAFFGIVMQVNLTKAARESAHWKEIEEDYRERAILALSIGGEMIAISKLINSRTNFLAGKKQPGIPMADYRIPSPLIFKALAPRIGSLMSPVFSSAVPMFYSGVELWNTSLVEKHDVIEAHAVHVQTVGHLLSGELSDYGDWAKNPLVRRQSDWIFEHNRDRIEKLATAFGIELPNEWYDSYGATFF